MYEILLSQKPIEGVDLVVYVDAVKPLQIPGPVAISIGNKEKIYKDWLNKNLFSQANHQQLLHFLVRLHDKGIEKGKMNLICRCKYNKFHGKVLKEVLEENRDMLTSLISYLVPDSANKSILDKAKEATEQPTMPMQANMTLDSLPVSDREQIQALIKADMEKTSNLVANVNEELIVDAELVTS